LEGNSFKKDLLLVIIVSGITISHPITLLYSISLLLLACFILPILSRAQIKKLPMATLLPILLIAFAWTAYSDLKNVILTFTFTQTTLPLAGLTVSPFLTGLDFMFSSYRSVLAYSLVGLAILGLVASWRTKETKLLFVILCSIIIGSVPYLFFESYSLLFQRLFMFVLPFACMLGALGLSKVKSLYKPLKIRAPNRIRNSLKVLGIVGLALLLTSSFIATQSPPNGYLYSNFVHKWEENPSIFVSLFSVANNGVATDQINIIIFRYYSGQSHSGTTWTGGGNVTDALQFFANSQISIISKLRLAFASGSLENISKWTQLEHELMARGYNQAYDSGYVQIYYK
jgi:hypothetical protein